MNENKLQRHDGLYIALSILFCTLVIISNVITIKLFKAPFFEGFALPAGLITYPLSFIISDLVTEVFGEAKAKLMVCLGLAMNLVALILIQFAIYLPMYDAANQQVFTSAFEVSTVAALGSMSAYIFAQLVDIKIFGWIKKFTNDRHLWLRNNASTLISQFIDSVIVDSIIFLFGFGFSVDYVVNIILISYAYKAFFSVANTPLFYLSVYTAKRFIQSKDTPGKMSQNTTPKILTG